MHIDMTDAADYWHGFEKMCMGSNIQMVFYRNQKCNVLVKILRNEVETSIPSLKHYTDHITNGMYLKNISRNSLTWKMFVETMQNTLDFTMGQYFCVPM